MHRYLLIVVLLAVVAAAAPSPLAAQEAAEGSDLWIESQLTTTYTLNEHLNPLDIGVKVKDGVVTLSGAVENDVEKDLAGEIAKGVDGVKKVRNNIETQPLARTEPSKLSGYMDTVNDATITARVKSNLLWNKNTDGLDIGVDTKNGVVTLAGTVKSSIQRDLAVQMARNTSGVRKVVDKLKIDPDAPGVTDAISESVGTAAKQAGQAVNDAWITSKVKTVLTFNKHADGADINVSTRDGVVTLEGTVPSARQKRRVADLARDVVNVKSVVDKLEVYE
jgi:hyperosmotically inducible periplasmic protein